MRRYGGRILCSPYSLISPPSVVDPYCLIDKARNNSGVVERVVERSPWKGHLIFLQHRLFRVTDVWPDYTWHSRISCWDSYIKNIRLFTTNFNATASFPFLATKMSVSLAKNTRIEYLRFAVWVFLEFASTGISQVLEVIGVRVSRISMYFWLHLRILCDLHVWFGFLY